MQGCHQRQVWACTCRLEQCVNNLVCILRLLSVDVCGASQDSKKHRGCELMAFPAHSFKSESSKVFVKVFPNLIQATPRTFDHLSFASFFTSRTKFGHLGLPLGAPFGSWPTLAKPTLANVLVFWPNFLNPKKPKPQETQRPTFRPEPKPYTPKPQTRREGARPFGSTLRDPTLRGHTFSGFAHFWRCWCCCGCGCCGCCWFGFPWTTLRQTTRRRTSPPPDPLRQTGQNFALFSNSRPEPRKMGSRSVGPEGWGQGFTRQSENSKRAHFRAPALQTPPKFHMPHEPHFRDVKHLVAKQLGNLHDQLKAWVMGNSLCVPTGMSTARPAQLGHGSPCRRATGKTLWSSKLAGP